MSTQTDLIDTLPDGFMKDFTSFILERCPTTPEWALAQSLVLLSLTAGRNVHIEDATGPIHLNVLFLNVGPSRLGWKSVPIKYYTRPTLEKFGELVGKDFRIPEKHTVEGLTKYLTPKRRRGRRPATPTPPPEGEEQQAEQTPEPEQQNTEQLIVNNEGIIIYDELSALFKDVSSKRYMSGGLEFLSQLYDGYLAKRTTITHGSHGGIPVFVSMLAATTEYFFITIDRTFFTQGTGNRILYIMSEPEEMPENEQEIETYALNYFNVIGNEDVDLDQHIIEYATRLSNMRRLIPNIIRLADNASVLAFKYKNETHNIGVKKWREDWRALDYSFFSQRFEIMMKLAGLYAISAQERDFGLGRDVVTISRTAVQWAIDRMEEFTTNFYELLNKWPQAMQTEETVRTLSNDFDFFKSIIKDFGNQATRTQLRRKTRYDMYKFNKVIEAMVAAEEIKIVTQEAGTQGGRPTTFYKIPEEVNE